MELKGILKKIDNEMQVSEKFRKRDFVLTTDDKYPQHISFQLTQDRVDLLDQYNIDDEITVHFNLRGREWTSPKGEVKYFNTLEAWRIQGKAGTATKPAEEKTEVKPEAKGLGQEPVDDLPF